MDVVPTCTRDPRSMDPPGGSISSLVSLAEPDPSTASELAPDPGADSFTDFDIPPFHPPDIQLDVRAHLRKSPSSKVSRSRMIVVAASVVYALVLLAAFALRPVAPHLIDQICNAHGILPAFFAGACALVYFRKGRHTSPFRRVGWLLIALTSLCYAFGQTWWIYYDVVAPSSDVSAPFWASAGGFSVYPLLAGLTLLFGSVPFGRRARLLIDGALAASAIGMLRYYSPLQHEWLGQVVRTVSTAVTSSYPLIAILCLYGGIVVLKVLKGDKELHRSFAFLCSGVMLWVLADSLYAYGIRSGANLPAGMYTWGWSFGEIMIGYAALCPLWWPEKASVDRAAIHRLHETRGAARATSLDLRGLLGLGAPYLAAGFAFVLVASEELQTNDSINLPVFALAGVLILLLLLRQMVTLVENQRLAAKLQGFNATLERTVAQRTDQLSILHQLSRAINNSLRVEDVLSSAVRHTSEAMQADAVGIWLLDENGNPPFANRKAYVHIGLESHPQLWRSLLRKQVRDSAETVRIALSPSSDKPATAMCLRAPLVWKRRTIGMIDVISTKGSFESTEPQVLESIGLEIGTAVENARLYQAAVRAADRDPLTGLLNHRAMQQQLNQKFSQAVSHRRPVSVMVTDINNFKLFNDTYGHPVGDQVLKKVAEVLQTECRRCDIVGRHGGDEFIIVLPGADVAAARKVAQRIEAKMKTEGFTRPGEDRTVPVTLGVGIAAYPADGSNRFELISVADSNLYAAKQQQGGIITSTELQRSNRALRTDGSFPLLDVMVTAVDNQDSYTRIHSENVTEYALWIAHEIGLSQETLRVIRKGCLLHDVGKIGVPSEVLRKPGRLTEAEYEAMKRHPMMGALIVQGIPGMEDIVDAVRSHHERWDGQGYPDGLAAENIPLLARIVTVADAFSAMTTDRPYRRALSWEIALQHIRDNLGTQFDAELGRVFIRVAERYQAERLAAAAQPLQHLPTRPHQAPVRTGPSLPHSLAGIRSFEGSAV